MSEELKANWEEITSITRLAGLAEEKVREYKESKKKEKKRELENSVVSLTEENRDINSLLRVALVEKEAVEKRLKENSEQKRVALLQIPQRELQRIGFGFVMGSGNTEQSSVEELLMEIKESEAEVVRWREACELEVEGGKKEIRERDKLVAILKQQLEKTRAALNVADNKLKLKEELAAAAMVAQAAAEKSLQLADSRAAGLCQRIERLSRQLEEADS